MHFLTTNNCNMLFCHETTLSFTESVVNISYKRCKAQIIWGSWSFFNSVPLHGIIYSTCIWEDPSDLGFISQNK